MCRLLRRELKLKKTKNAMRSAAPAAAALRRASAATPAKCFALGRATVRIVSAAHRIAALGAARALPSDVLSAADALERSRVVAASFRGAPPFQFASACGAGRALAFQFANACSAGRATTCEFVRAGNPCRAPAFQFTGGRTQPARNPLRRGRAKLP